METPFYHYPIRQVYGAALLLANKSAEGEKVFRADLKPTPYNGWSLYGLAQSIKAQNKTDEAERMQRRFEEVWEYSDLESPFDSSRSVAARE